MDYSLPPPPRIAVAAPIVWQTAADALVRSGEHVTVHAEAISALLSLLKASTDHSYWRDYVSPVDRNRPDIGSLCYELALTISQFGGFIHYRSDGSTDSWKLAGSGVKAILATMAEIRAARKLPGIDIHEDFDRELAHFLIDKPFGRERLAMMKEIAQYSSPAFFVRMVSATRSRAGQFHFNGTHVLGLASRLPRCFGEDGEFYKKASLLFMTMEIALGQLGYAATAATIPPADYRIPQILESFGILRFTPALSQKLGRKMVFCLNAPEVRAMRAATVQAVGLIKIAFEKHSGAPVSSAALDGMLYMLSRDKAVMQSAAMKPHMQVATLAF